MRDRMAGGSAGDWGEGRPHQRDQGDTRRSRQGDNTTHPSLQYRPVNPSATAAAILTSHLSPGKNQCQITNGDKKIMFLASARLNIT